MTGPALTRIPVPPAADDLRDLLERIDSGMADPDRDHDLGWPLRAAAAGTEATRSRCHSSTGPGWSACSTNCTSDFGAASFTAQWQYDRHGLLDAATRLLDDLRLVRRMPGGVAILPAAARYRNITAALPGRARRDGQGDFDFSRADDGGHPA